MIKKPQSISRLEFILMMALLISLPALSLDSMLSAMQVIGSEFLVKDPNSIQIIVTSLFLGMAIGQIFFGPLSDSIGRKPLMYVGMGIFLIGSAVCIFSQTYQQFIIGRLLQGFGMGAPRVLCVALIRDKYKGKVMAKLMSNVMTVFIFVPMIAPLMGQSIMLVASWEMIFIVISIIGLLSLIWFWLRLEETLVIEKRRPFTIEALYNASREVLLNPHSRGYTITSGITSGVFVAYISTSPQIFQQQYLQQESFVFIFAGLSLCFGITAQLNSFFVIKYGMNNIVSWSLNIMFAVAVIFLMLCFYYQGHPPLWMLISYFALTIASLGSVAGNVSAMSMEPLGHIAGIGSTIVSTGSSIISVGIGVLIGSLLGSTITPLIVGFVICSGLSRYMVYHTQRAVLIPAS